MGFDPREAFPADPKLLGDEPDARAEVWVAAVRADAVERELGDAAVRERRYDGSIVIEVPCASEEAFRSWLFGLGVHAQVLAPPELRTAIIDWLRALVAAA